MKTTKNTYASNKAVARQEAIDWQNDLFRDNRSYAEMQDAAEHFKKLGKRYGLLNEFRENGIC